MTNALDTVIERSCRVFLNSPHDQRTTAGHETPYTIF